MREEDIQKCLDDAAAVDRAFAKTLEKCFWEAVHAWRASGALDDQPYTLAIDSMNEAVKPVKIKR